jgi:hypothetical protein
MSSDKLSATSSPVFLLCLGCLLSSVNRNKVTLHKSFADADDHGFMPGSEADRLLAVWELTKEAWALFDKEDAEQRLQRDVVLICRLEN